MTAPPVVAIIEPVGGHGGMEPYDLGLAIGLRSAGVRPILFTSQLTNRDAEDAETPFAGVYGRAPKPWRALRFATAYRRALRSARRNGCELAHLHFFSASRLEELTVGWIRRSGLRIVVTAHDVLSLAHGDRPDRARRLYEGVDRVIVHNRASLEELRTLAPRVAADVIPHGNYLHYLGDSVEPRDARRRLGLAVDAPVLLFFGQLKRVKGLDLLLDALERPGTAPSAQLVIAGRAWKDDPERYRSRIRAAGLGERVHLHHGFVPDAEVPTYMAAADLVVLPYERVYQSGVVLHAMSYGRPVLVSDLEAMRETVDDGVTGFTFRHGDAAHLAQRLTALLAEPERLRRVGAAGLEAVRRDNDWNAIGRATIAVYRRALEEPLETMSD